MAVRSGNKKTVTTRRGSVLPRNRALGPRNTGIIWDLLGPDVGTRALAVQVDAGLRINGLLGKDTDCAFGISAAFQTDADCGVAMAEAVELQLDVVVRVSGRLHSERDSMLQIFDLLIHSADVGLAVAGDLERFADAAVRVAGLRQFEPDAAIVVIGMLDRSADVYLEITDAGLIRADAVLVVTRPMFFASDTELLMLQRLVPDLATVQTVYAVLIHESHPIQV